MPATEQPQQQSLLAWLSQLALNHNNSEPPTTKLTQDSEPPTPKPAREDSYDNHKDADSITDGNSVNSKKSSTPSTFSRHFKNHLMHFHRPHGLFHRQLTRNRLNTSEDSNNVCSCKEKQQEKRQKRPSGSSNDADDEDEGGDSDSVRSRDGTQRPPCSCSKTATHMYGDDDDNLDIKRHREHSVFSLPGDVDSPEIGFKKIERDGDLVDYDDISVIEEEEEYQDNRSLEMRARYRSVIRNNLIALAFNGPFDSRPFQSPIQTGEKKQVLHVGCGNGAWCAQVAQLFPHWLVVGIDDKTGGPIVDQRKVPTNFKYIRCYYDVLRTLKDIPSDSFDLILCRFMIFVYTEEDYNKLIREIHRICKPGGFAEFNELDMRVYGNPRAGPMTHTLNSKVFGTMEANNLNPRLARKLGSLVSAVFVTNKQSDAEVSKKDKKKYYNANYTSLPMGVWGGRLGVMFRDDINDLIEYFQVHQSEHTADISNSETEGTNELNFEDIETMEEEMECQKSFMNLHHVYTKKSD